MPHDAHLFMLWVTAIRPPLLLGDRVFAVSIIRGVSACPDVSEGPPGVIGTHPMSSGCRSES